MAATGTFTTATNSTTVTGTKFSVRLAFADGGPTGGHQPSVHLQTQMASTAWLTVKSYTDSANDVYDPGQSVTTRLVCDNTGQSIEYDLTAV